MGMMIDLYEDKIMAVIREYSTNAWDSHVEAGIHRPIEITLPNDLMPFFRIQDYGIGLDYEGIETIYSRYGASTKRETNDFNGMLGVGCKSALTYADQFTLIAIKDGIKTHVIVSRLEDDNTEMVVVAETSTDEGNGVTVEIPVSAGEEKKFADKAAAFYQFWPSGTVLVNGVEPERHGGMELDHDLFMTDFEGEDAYKRDIIVMGNVPYPVRLNHGVPDKRVVAYVPIGAVEFMNSREALNETKKTNATIAEVNERLAIKLGAAISREINEAPDPVTALRKYLHWMSVLPGHSLKSFVKREWQGKEIPNAYKHPRPADEKDGDKPDTRELQFIVSPMNSTKLSSFDRYYEVVAGWMSDALVVTDFFPNNFTPTHKKKMKKHAQESGLDLTRVICCKSLPEGMEWIDAANVVSYDIIKEIKLPHTVRREARVAGSYRCEQHGGTILDVQAQHLKDFIQEFDGPVFWGNRNSYLFDKGSLIIRKTHPDAVFVELPENRIAKFKRDFPEVQYIGDVVAAQYDAEREGISDEVLYAQKVCREHRTLQNLEPEKLKDPQLRKLVRLVCTDTSSAEALNKYDNVLHLIGRTNTIKKKIPLNDGLEDYPLFNWREFRNHTDHMYAYLNSAYPLVKKARIERRKQKGKK
jgi:hypothetical protein